MKANFCTNAKSATSVFGMKLKHFEPSTTGIFKKMAVEPSIFLVVTVLWILQYILSYCLYQATNRYFVCKPTYDMLVCKQTICVWCRHQWQYVYTDGFFWPSDIKCFEHFTLGAFGVFQRCHLAPFRHQCRWSGGLLNGWLGFAQDASKNRYSLKWWWKMLMKLPWQEVTKSPYLNKSKLVFFFFFFSILLRFA